jgi:PAS domain S-box-containing protein
VRCDLTEEASMGWMGELRMASHAGGRSEAEAVPDDVDPARTAAPHPEIQDALSASYRTVFDALDEAFCVIEMILDDRGAAADYRLVEVNRAYEEHTGMTDVVGKTARQLLPDIEPFWIETYGRVARTGEPVRFAREVRSLNRWFDVYAFPLGTPEGQRVAIHFTDITDRKRAEEELRHRSEQFRALVQQAPIGVYLIDADFRIAAVNPVARTGVCDVV